MHSSLGLPSCKWHFKRAARARDEPWSPQIEPSQTARYDANPGKHQGSNDPRLDGWMQVETIPNDPFLLLQNAGIIPDPAIGLNEDQVQWVGETDWVFRCVFETPEDLKPDEAVDLLADGLDTFATVFINDKKCHSSENGFMSYRISLTDHMRKKRGDGNVLMFHFASAFREGRKHELKHGKRVCWNGDTSRVFVRKPQYHYGWDWGPTLLTCGILGTPSLHVYTHRLGDLRIETENDEVVVTGQISFAKDISRHKDLTPHASESQLEIKVQIQYEDKSWEHAHPCQREEHFAGLEAGRVSMRVKVPDVQQWWPIGQGKQPLYTVRVVLLDGEEQSYVLDSYERRVGFRKIELIQEPFNSQSGTSFYFRVNGRPIFLAGSNWIPADSYPNRVTREDYRQLLTLLIQGGQNAIRVWGGGYYEQERFYDLCDEMGILVWQDFMFACGAYPADVKAFRDDVRTEAVHAVKRLAHHACLALFAGNNEDYQIAEAEKLEWDSENHDPEAWLKTTFPARYLYEHMLPEIVKENSRVAYHPGSPWKSGHDTRDPTKGDIHQWNVWHGSQEDYQDWDKIGGRFVSEFGMHALPVIRTVKSFAGHERLDQHPQSRVMALHNKATGGVTRLSQYMIKNLQYTMDIEDYIYASQLMQADCLSTAYQLWRREWRGPGKEYCGGALVWQINDVYPCISWSIVDYYKRPKLAYYAIKRVIQPITINLKRVKKLSRPDPLSAREVVQHSIDVWSCNASQEERFAKLEIHVVDITSGHKVSVTTEPVRLAANCSSEYSPQHVKADIEQEVVIVARLYDVHDEMLLLAEAFSWPDPLRYMKPNGAKVGYELDRHGVLRVWTDLPVKGVTFAFDQDVCMEDNGFDLVPGQERQIRVIASAAKDGSESISRPVCRWYNGSHVIR